MIRPRHASHITVGALALAALLLPAFAAAQPSLAYDPPAGWTSGPYSSPVVYTAPGGAAELHVYDFQRYAGDAKRRFRETRLFELIGIEHRETGPLEPAKYAEIQVQGAGAVPLAIFVEQRGGVNRLHVRVAIPQPGAVALVDYHARSQDAWNRYLPEVDRVFASMRVGEAPAAPASAPRPAQGMPSSSQARAGFYVMSTLKLRLIPDFSGGRNTGTELQPAYEFYLLSADGRIYRNSGWGVVTAQNIDRFDFNAARIREPDNVGSYTDEADHVTIRIQGQTIVATIVAGGALRIGNSTYERRGFK